LAGETPAATVEDAGENPVAVILNAEAYANLVRQAHGAESFVWA
jgi:hypothetical protein